MTKRIIALLLALILTVGLLPTVALAAKDQGTTTPAATATLTPDKGYYKFDGKSTSESNADITLSKTAVDNKDGTYTVTLEATAKTKVQPKPTEVVFVLDASGSMAWCCEHGEHKNEWGGYACSHMENNKDLKSRWDTAKSAIQTMVFNLSQKLGDSVTFKYVVFDSKADVCNEKFQVWDEGVYIPFIGYVGGKWVDVTAGGSTHLTAGVNKGIGQFSNDPDTVKALIIVADGDSDDGYPSQSANNFKNNGGTIYTVGFMFKNDNFDSLASDGCKFNANNTNELTTAMGTIEAKIIGMIDDPLGAKVDLVANSLKLVKDDASSTQPNPTTKDNGRTITWTDKSGMTHVKLTYTVKLKDEVTETVGANVVALNGNATFNYSYKQGSTTVSKSLSFPKPQATVYVASLDVKYRLESETGTEVNVAATSEISGTSHEVKQLPYTFEAKLPAVGDTVTANGKTYYVKSVTGATDKANTPLEATVANADAHTITVVLTETAPTASYKVEHYKEKVDGTFPATADETDDLTGSTGAPVTATAKTYSGFTCDKSVYGTIESGTIAADGSLVLKLYYTRNSYTVTYTDGVDGAEVFADDVHNNVAYGDTIPVFTNGTPTREGYNFTGWTSSVTEVTTSSTMPDSNVTFTAGWTPKNKATINYEVVGPAGCGSVNPANEWKYVDDLTAAKGSTATANTGYRFVGWYDNEDCTDDALSTDLKYVPQTPTEKWANATYYAKFESLTYTITFTTEAGGTLTGKTEYTGLAYNADFPTEPGKVANTGYYFDGWYKDDTKVTLPGNVTENATYTAKWKKFESATLNLTNKFWKELTSDTATLPENANSFTLNIKNDNSQTVAQAHVLNVPLEQKSGKYSGTKAFAVESGSEMTFNAPGEYFYTVAETEGSCSGMSYDKTTYTMTVMVVAKEGRLTIQSATIQGGAGDTVDLLATEVTNSITFHNEYTQPKKSINLGDLIQKDFDKKEGSEDLPTGSSYTFRVQAYERFQNSDGSYRYSNAPYLGEVVMTKFGQKNFVFNNGVITFFEPGTHEYVVEEFNDGAENVEYDSNRYLLVLGVADDLTITARNAGSLSDEVSTQSVEQTPVITFCNKYNKEKDPDKLTINFSDFVQKELTATGSKTASDVNFTVNVKESPIPLINSTQGVEAVSTYAGELLSTTLNAHFDSITGGETKTTPFTGSVKITSAGQYTFELREEDGQRTGVTYDETIYTLHVLVDEEDGSLAVTRWYFTDSNRVEHNAGEKAAFHNTIDTGKDDYYPIIIPTIINKDTGMLNKTDHFAYVIGYPDGTVHPNGQITRAEVATIFFRLLRDEVRDGAFTTSNSYSDVAYGKWYNNPISTMSALGIITGYPDGTFKPNKPITRAEFAAIAARFDETQSGKSATFSDVIGHWAAKEIGIAYYNDWIKGYPDGTFKPDQNITRAEAMTLINRVLERKPESPADLLTNMNKWTDNMDTSKWYYLDVQEATNSHGYTRKTFNYELWRQMLPDPDWSRYER